MTETYAFLNVSRECFDEIKDKLVEADYLLAFQYDSEGRTIVINMRGLALRVEQEDELDNLIEEVGEVGGIRYERKRRGLAER